MNRNRKSAPKHELHFFMKHARIALDHASQVHTQMNETPKTGCVRKPFLLNPVEIIERIDHVRWQAIDVSECVASAQQRMAMGV